MKQELTPEHRIALIQYRFELIVMPHWLII